MLVSYQTKLSRLCEQDKVLRTQEEKLQQLYREKVSRLTHTTQSEWKTPANTHFTLFKF